MLRSLLRLAAIALLVAMLFVGWSVAGRGTRPALGEKTSALATSDHRVVYYALGEGESVVLLSSLGRPASDFNELVTALVRGGFRTLAVDAGLPLRDAFPQRITLVQVPGAGHALLPEQPATIERSLLAFLRCHPVN